MNPLIISDAEKERVSDLLAYVSRRENWYHPGKSKFIPGDCPEYWLMLGGYRCVFSVTELEGTPLRHLSISVKTDGKYPHPIAAFNIAAMFGFTDGVKSSSADVVVEPGKNWGIDINHKEHCIVMIQEIPSAEIKAKA